MKTPVVPLKVGQIDIDLVFEQGGLDEVFHQKYGLFLRTGGGDGFPVHIAWQASGLIPAQMDMQLDYSPGVIGVHAPGYAGEFREDLGAHLRLESAEPTSGIDYFLRVVIAALAFQAGGLMMHGAGILRRGMGYIFFGHSGSGKTTVSRLSQQVVVLNDDFLVLHPVEKTWMAYATPFWHAAQVKPSNRSMQVNSLYRLVKDHSVYLEAMTPAQAVGEMVANIPISSGDPARLPEVMERCRQISAAAPVYWLHFLKDDSFWKVIDRG